jgi:hypothetical protein
MNIYYCYDKKTGKFVGSGINSINTTEYGSTLISCPNYDKTSDIPYWDFINNKWIIKEK